MFRKMRRLIRVLAFAALLFAATATAQDDDDGNGCPPFQQCEYEANYGPVEYQRCHDRFAEFDLHYLEQLKRNYDVCFILKIQTCFSINCYPPNCYDTKMAEYNCAAEADDSFTWCPAIEDCANFDPYEFVGSNDASERSSADHASSFPWLIPIVMITMMTHGRNFFETEHGRSKTQ